MVLFWFVVDMKNNVADTIVNTIKGLKQKSKPTSCTPSDPRPLPSCSTTSIPAQKQKQSIPIKSEVDMSSASSSSRDEPSKVGDTIATASLLLPLGVLPARKAWDQGWGFLMTSGVCLHHTE